MKDTEDNEEITIKRTPPPEYMQPVPEHPTQYGSPYPVQPQYAPGAQRNAQFQFPYPDVPPPAPPKKKHRIWLWVVVGIIGLILLGSVNSLMNGEYKPPSEPAPVATAQPAHPVQPTAPPKKVDPQPTQPKVTVKQQVAEWYAKHGSIISVIGKDVTKLSVDLQTGDMKVVRQDAVGIQEDVKTAKTAPPIPDRQCNEDYTSFLNDTYAAMECLIYGIDNQDATTINTAAVLLNSATVDATALADDIQNLK